MEDKWNAFIDPAVTLWPKRNGLLDGYTFAVKDVFAVKGHRNAAGNPDWYDFHPAAGENAPVIEWLLNEGARLTGMTHTDELMYSLNGENFHYGTPVNPVLKDRIPGGSSSGSAVAVAAGCTDFAIGTDTGGSVRIPSAYCGIFGFRPSHGVIKMEGVIPLAPSFDTIGWMSKDPGILYKVGQVLFKPDQDIRPQFESIFFAEDAWELAGEETRKLLESKWHHLLKNRVQHVVRTAIADQTLKSWSHAFRLLQGREVWKTHGAWIEHARPQFGPDIAERFKWASTIVEDSHWEKANQLRLNIRDKLRGLLGSSGLLVLPTTPGPAPATGRSMEEIEKTREHTMQLSCIAGLAGLPQLTIPFLTATGEPIGLSVVAGYRQDVKLLAWVEELMLSAD